MLSPRTIKTFILYFLVNKRLDEWVDESRMKLDQLQGPRQVDVKTPVKGAGSTAAVGSRPVSPTPDHSQCSTPTPSQMKRSGPPFKKKKLDEVRCVSVICW